MILVDSIHSVKIGYGSCYTQNSVVATSRQTQALKGLLHKGAALLGGSAVFTELLGGHSGIQNARLVTAQTKSFVGEFSCRIYSLTDSGRALALFGLARNLVIGNGGKLNFYINTVKERTADSFKIFTDCAGRTATAPCRVAKIATLTGIHSADEHKGRRIGHLCCRAGNGNHAVLQGLTKRLAYALGELGKLVKEQNTVMCKGNLTGTGICTAANHTRRADGVMRRTEGTLGNQIRAQNTRNRMDFRGFHSLVKAHIGENGGQSFCQHRLTCAGRTYHQNVVTACSGNFKSTLCLKLTANVGKIKLTDMSRKVEGRGVKAHRSYKLHALKVIYKLSEALHRIYQNAVYHCRLACVFLGHEDLPSARLSCRNGHRQNTPHGTKLT